jgi:hypothetical protein
MPSSLTSARVLMFTTLGRSSAVTPALLDAFVGAIGIEDVLVAAGPTMLSARAFDTLKGGSEGLESLSIVRTKWDWTASMNRFTQAYMRNPALNDYVGHQSPGVPNKLG